MFERWVAPPLTPGGQLEALMLEVSRLARPALVLLALASMLSCHKAHEIDSPPGTPSVPAGPISGSCDSLYRFTTSAADPDADSVALRFSWGDGDTSAWTRFVASGESAWSEHAWYYAGACSVKAQARDPHGALSDWSEPAAIGLLGGARFADTVIARIPVAGSPIDVAILPSGEYAYVTCYNDNTVAVIRTSDNAVVGAISVGSGPWGAAASPDGQYVYVTNTAGWNGSISVIRTSDNTVVRTIQAGYEPTELAFSPDGSYLYVCDCTNLMVFRTSDDSLVARIEVGEYPMGLAVLPDGRYVLVTVYDGDCYCIVDAHTNTLSGSVEVGFGPWGLAVAKGGQAVYVAVEDSYWADGAAISTALAPDFQLSDSLVPLGADMPATIALSPDSGYLYVLFEETEVAWMAVISTRSMKLIGFVLDPAIEYLGYSGIACLPNGLVYVANEDEDCVSVFGFSGNPSRNACFRPHRREP